MTISHIYVPKHFILSEEEVEEYEKQFNFSKEKLPIVKSSDVIVKSLGAKAGDVLKIMRMSPITKKEELFFRLVVE